MCQHSAALLLLIALACKNSGPTSSRDGDPGGSYPATVFTLNASESDSLKSVLHQKLGTRYLAQLDSFGLLGYYHGGVGRPRGSTLANPAQAVSLARSAILELSQFTNVVDTSALVVRRAEINGATRDWEIIFANQSYNGLEVWNTRIDAIVADQFILLYQAHHYRDIVIPRQHLISKARAKSKLVGTEIKYQCWSAASYVIADSSIHLAMIEECIYPLVTSNSVELHVVWKVPINRGGPTGWYYFIDVMSGDVIASEQLFVC